MEDQLQLCLETLDRAQSPCTDCGLCNAACESYLASGWEHESPRGRIRLARAFRDGQIDPSDPVLQSFDRCVGCQACETACPEQVQLSVIRDSVQQARELLTTPAKRSWWRKLWG